MAECLESHQKGTLLRTKGIFFYCDVPSNKVPAITWLQTIEPGEMRQSEDGLNESATHKLALLPVPNAEIVVII